MSTPMGPPVSWTDSFALVYPGTHRMIYVRLNVQVLHLSLLVKHASKKLEVDGSNLETFLKKISTSKISTRDTNQHKALKSAQGNQKKKHNPESWHITTRPGPTLHTLPAPTLHAPAHPPLQRYTALPRQSWRCAQRHVHPAAGARGQQPVMMGGTGGTGGASSQQEHGRSL